MFKKSILALILAAATGGCLEGFDEGGYIGSYSGSYSGGYYSGSPDGNYEDMLIVSGSGESVVIQYNTLTFTTKINWKDGNHYFSPDPDGKISGNKIICSASISSGVIDGDCFRNGQVCDFTYIDTWYDKDGKDVYALSTTTCKTAASVGPFLVPLDSPKCGSDPYPACPTTDLFPSGPTSGTGTTGGTTGGTTNGTTAKNTADDLIDTLCAAVERCDATLTKSACVTAMDGTDGIQIWDDFGLTKKENTLTTAKVREGLSKKSITVDSLYLASCKKELVEACDNVGETFPVGSYSNVENVILEYGACPLVLTESTSTGS